MMKKYLRLALTIGMAVAGSACSSGSDQQQPEQEDTAKVAPEDQPAEEVDAPFSYKNDTIERKYKTIKCSINADFAKDGNEQLVKNVNAFINEELGRQHSNEITDTKEFLAFYANQRLDEMKNYWDEKSEYADETQVLFNHETEKYISYTSHRYSYTGGAHGTTTNNGASFRKSDGKQLTWDMFKDVNSNEFKQLLKEGIKGYFEGATGEKFKSDKDFKEALLNVKDVNDLPLPAANPFFSKKGLVIHYGSYEIASYACGQPEFILPFATAKKFLKEPGYLY